MVNLKALLDYRLKSVETPKKKWPLKERIHHWWIEKTWEFKQRSYIMKAWYAFAHRYIPKHQYNKIIIRDLKPGYYDPDTRIRHGLFQELCDYLDGTDNTIEWSEKQSVYDELNSVRNYWRIGRPLLVKQEEEALTKWHDNRFKNDKKDWIDQINAPRTEEDDNLFKKHSDIEQFIFEEDKRHLKIIIDHLSQLWYP